MSDQGNPLSISFNNCCALPKCTKNNKQQGVELKACGACTIPHYCCKEHQVEHFKNGGHKYICKGRKSGEPLSFNECNTKAGDHFAKNEYKDAISYYSAMIELTERTLGVFHIQIANILDTIVKCLLRIEQYTDAIECLQRMLLIYEYDQATVTTFDESVLATKSSMVQALNDVKMPKMAFYTLGRLAEAYFAAGQDETAKKLFERLVDEAKTNYGEDSIERAKALVSLAAFLANVGELQKAEENLIIAAGIIDSSVDPTSASNVYSNLAHVQKLLKKNKEAATSIQAYINVLKGAGYDSNSPEIIEANSELKLIEA
jgi:tetratricopeptide (TPR) repeat protein